MFRPTYLYIKQHTITGLKYFGKTIKNPEKYPGSGRHWLRHLKKHGKEHVITLWSQLFTDQTECVEYATNFSIANDIIKSHEWANAIMENGLDGAQPGHAPFCEITDEFRAIQAERSRLMWEGKREVIVEAQRLAANKPERKAQYSEISKKSWTNNDARKKQQSETAKRVWENHRDKILNGLTKPRSQEHKKNISAALSGIPKEKTVCRIDDRKEMHLFIFTRWLNRQSGANTPLISP